MDEYRRTVNRANLDGSGVEELVRFKRDDIYLTDIALDVAGGKMYWIANGKGVMRANLDGSSVETVFSLLSGGVLGLYDALALNIPDGKIYVTNMVKDDLCWYGLDGSLGGCFSDVINPFGVAIAK